MFRVLLTFLDIYVVGVMVFIITGVVYTIVQFWKMPIGLTSALKSIVHCYKIFFASLIWPVLLATADTRKWLFEEFYKTQIREDDHVKK